MISHKKYFKALFITYCCIILMLTGCKQIGYQNEKVNSPLKSLKLIDDFPMYTMKYEGEYSWSSKINMAGSTYKTREIIQNHSLSFQFTWGCSLFAALGNSQTFLYGRNFDWNFSPALLLFVKPAQGYASVSMVDITYLGYEGERAKNLLGLSIEEQQALLDAPSLPFDGMNEKGLVIGMASVPAGNMPDNSQKSNIDSLLVIREMLDHAATVEEAVDILGKYDIDMGSVPLHYLIADRSGDAVLIEFFQGEMFVQNNENPWHLATNFIVAESSDKARDRCHRYDKITAVMEDNLGNLSISQAFSLLEDVSSGDPTYGTQWSIVYDITSGGISVVMGRNYEKVYTFNLYEQ